MKFNYDVIFLCGLFPHEMEKEIFAKSKGFVEHAANSLQWRLVEGFDANLTEPVKLLNALYIGSYPKRYSSFRIKTKQFSHFEGCKDVNVGFCNLIGIKYKSREIGIKRNLKKWLTDNSSKQKIVIAYAMTSPFIASLAYVKKINPSVKTCVIVPDLPQFMNTNSIQSMVTKIYRRIDKYRINRYIESVDCYVLFAEAMIKSLPPKKLIVMEGIYTDNFNNMSYAEGQKKKIIFYAGELRKQYGIGNLLEAFSQIKSSEYELLICGTGEMQDEIIEKQQSDNRIIYLGRLPQEEVFKYEIMASVLVNPRQGNAEFTRYSFPSKNLEYLSSGIPVVCYKLDGIPAEYDRFFHYVETDTISDLRDKLVEVCSMSKEEKFVKGRTARQFLLKEKGAITQTRRILNLLDSI